MTRFVYLPRLACLPDLVSHLPRLAWAGAVVCLVVACGSGASGADDGAGANGGEAAADAGGSGPGDCAGGRTSSGKGGTSGKEAHANVLLIVADDLGVAAVGADELANEEAYSPRLDELAASGVRVREGYAADGMCWPSRGSILTGMYPQRWNMAKEFPTSIDTVANVLSRRGFVTGCIGKWHNGEQSPYHPLDRGFDEFFGFLGGAHDYFEPNVGYESGDGGTVQIHSPIYDGRTPVDEMSYLTDELTDRAIDFIERHQESPFFLFLAYNARHAPNQYPEDYAERFPGQGIGHTKVVEAILDQNVGRLLDELEGRGLRDDTLVIFVGDNGGNKRTNGPLRDSKGTLYEGGIRVPWIVSWPGRLPNGVTREGPVMHVDLLPTIADATGDSVATDGASILPLLDGEVETIHDALFWSSRGRDAVRQGSWKLVVQPEGSELFDLAQDPFEQSNLFQVESKLAAELQVSITAGQSSL